MSDFRAGQRVRTTILITVEGGRDLPVGSQGTIVSERNAFGKYGVLLDADLSRLPASFEADQLGPAQ